MASDFSALTRNIHMSVQGVTRELVGMIPAVDLDTDMAMAAKGQTVKVSVANANAAADFTPANVAPSGTDITPSTKDVVINKSRKVSFNVSGEQKLAVENTIEGSDAEYWRAELMQGIRTLTNEMETDLAALYDEAASSTGTAGTTPFSSTLADAANVKKELNDRGVPQDNDVSLVVDTSAAANIRTVADLVQTNRAGTDTLQRQGILLPIFGMNVRESGQIATHTAGTGTGDTFAAEAAGQTTLSVSSFTTGQYLEGDVIAAGTGGRKYVVSSADPGASTLTINGQKGLIDAIASGTAVVRSADYTANMAFHRSAIKLVARMPMIPENATYKRMMMRDPVSGLPFLVLEIEQYGQITYEVHMAWGVSVIKEDWICLLEG